MQYRVSVIDNGTGPAIPTEEADISEVNVALRLDAEGAKAGTRTIEVRPFL